MAQVYELPNAATCQLRHILSIEWYCLNRWWQWKEKAYHIKIWYEDMMKTLYFGWIFSKASPIMGRTQGVVSMVMKIFLEITHIIERGNSHHFGKNKKIKVLGMNCRPCLPGTIHKDYESWKWFSGKLCIQLRYPIHWFWRCTQGVDEGFWSLSGAFGRLHLHLVHSAIQPRVVRRRQFKYLIPRICSENHWMWLSLLDISLSCLLRRKGMIRLFPVWHHAKDDWAGILDFTPFL